MHPVEVLIKLHQAKEAGATNPFNSTNENCVYNRSCQGCPAERACEFILDLSTETWSTNFKIYCKDYLHYYTYEELITEFPEYQI